MEMIEINGKNKYFEFVYEGTSSRDACPQGNQYKYKAIGKAFINIQSKDYVCHLYLNFSVPTLNNQLDFMVLFKASLVKVSNRWEVCVDPKDEVYMPEDVVQEGEWTSGQILLNNITQHSLPTIQTEIIRYLAHHLGI